MIIDEFRGDYHFLSNFFGCPFEYKGLQYQNAEAAFQAQKCATDDERIKYTTVKNPVVAKRMGKKEPNFPSDWDLKSPEIMREILKTKFSVPELKEKLAATGDAVLIEGNHWHDNRWGRCSCEKCKNKESQNLLGKILMEIRDEIK